MAFSFLQQDYDALIALLIGKKDMFTPILLWLMLLFVKCKCQIKFLLKLVLG